MKCAVIDPNTGKVVTVILANPAQDSIPDHLLVPVPGDMSVDDRWFWTEKEGFQPGPELLAEEELKIAAIEDEGLDMEN